MKRLLIFAIGLILFMALWLIILAIGIIGERVWIKVFHGEGRDG